MALIEASATDRVLQARAGFPASAVEQDVHVSVGLHPRKSQCGATSSTAVVESVQHGMLNSTGIIACVV